MDYATRSFWRAIGRQHWEFLLRNRVPLAHQICTTLWTFGDSIDRPSPLHKIVETLEDPSALVGKMQGMISKMPPLNAEQVLELQKFQDLERSAWSMDIIFDEPEGDRRS